MIAVLSIVVVCFAVLSVTAFRRSLILKRPIQRAGAILFWTGSALLFVGICCAIYEQPSFYDVNDSMSYSLTFSYWGLRDLWMVSIGFPASIAGLVLSYLYDATVGPVARWVMRG